MPKSKSRKPKKPLVILAKENRPKHRDLSRPWDKSDLRHRNNYRTQHNVRASGNLKQPAGRK